MSLEYIYKLNNSEFCMYCPEPTVLDSLAETCPDEMNDIFSVDGTHKVSFNDPKAKIKSDQLIQSIESLLKIIRNNKEIVPYLYYLEIDDPELGLLKTKMTGYYKIKSDPEHYYMVDAFFGNKCEILKMEKLKNGKVGELIEKKDIGSITSLEMESNNGPFVLNIKKRRGKLPLTADLKKLKAFIEENGPGTVTKILVG